MLPPSSEWLSTHGLLARPSSGRHSVCRSCTVAAATMCGPPQFTALCLHPLSYRLGQQPWVYAGPALGAPILFTPARRTQRRRQAPTRLPGGLSLPRRTQSPPLAAYYSVHFAPQQLGGTRAALGTKRGTSPRGLPWHLGVSGRRLLLRGVSARPTKCETRAFGLRGELVRASSRGKARSPATEVSTAQFGRGHDLQALGNGRKAARVPGGPAPLARAAPPAPCSWRPACPCPCPWRGVRSATRAATWGRGAESSEQVPTAGGAAAVHGVDPPLQMRAAGLVAALLLATATACLAARELQAAAQTAIVNGGSLVQGGCRSAVPCLARHELPWQLPGVTHAPAPALSMHPQASTPSRGGTATWPRCAPTEPTFAEVRGRPSQAAARLQAMGAHLMRVGGPRAACSLDPALLAMQAR